MTKQEAKEILNSIIMGTVLIKDGINMRGLSGNEIVTAQKALNLLTVGEEVPEKEEKKK